MARDIIMYTFFLKNLFEFHVFVILYYFKLIVICFLNYKHLVLYGIN
jgi:hypothetical protein